MSTTREIKWVHCIVEGGPNWVAVVPAPPYAPEGSPERIKVWLWAGARRWMLETEGFGWRRMSPEDAPWSGDRDAVGQAQAWAAQVLAEAAHRTWPAPMDRWLGTQGTTDYTIHICRVLVRYSGDDLMEEVHFVAADHDAARARMMTEADDAYRYYGRTDLRIFLYWAHPDEAKHWHQHLAYTGQEDEEEDETLAPVFAATELN